LEGLDKPATIGDMSFGYGAISQLDHCHKAIGAVEKCRQALLTVTRQRHTNRV
jgi:hypothetical protein